MKDWRTISVVALTLFMGILALALVQALLEQTPVTRSIPNDFDLPDEVTVVLVGLGIIVGIWFWATYVQHNIGRILVGIGFGVLLWGVIVSYTGPIEEAPNSGFWVFVVVGLLVVFFPLLRGR
jgi:hypothetical protein